MSDRASIILGHLGDADVLTVDELVEATGFERSAVSQELVALKAQGQCYSGRGGWRLAADPEAPAKVRRHEAKEPASDPDKLAKAKERMAKGRAKRKAEAAPKPARATRATRAATESDLPRDALYVFGITELGQLTITDRRDAAKTMRMSQVDTVRLALALKRWATLIAVGGKEAA